MGGCPPLPPSPSPSLPLSASLSPSPHGWRFVARLAPLQLLQPPPRELVRVPLLLVAFLLAPPRPLFLLQAIPRTIQPPERTRDASLGPGCSRADSASCVSSALLWHSLCGARGDERERQGSE